MSSCAVWCCVKTAVRSLAWRDTVPTCASSSPRISFKRVDLPEPVRWKWGWREAQHGQGGARTQAPHARHGKGHTHRSHGWAQGRTACGRERASLRCWPPCQLAVRGPASPPPPPSPPPCHSLRRSHSLSAQHPPTPAAHASPLGPTSATRESRSSPNSTPVKRGGLPSA